MNAKLKVKSSCSLIVRPVVVLASTLILLWGGMVRAEHDITSPGDMVECFPSDNDLPSPGHPALVIDDNINTSCYLEFKGGTQVTGFRVEPSVGPTVVTGLSFTAAGNAPERDPIAFELCGSNISIDGPYELIVSGNIFDFVQESAWPRRTKNKTPILFDNSIAYTYYQVLFTAVRDQWSAGGVQIAEVELLATVLQATSPEPINGSVVVVVPQLQWIPGETAVSHDLYFGTNPEPGPAEYISRLSTNIYCPTIEFKPGITYYWRVDEVEADGTIHTGTVWNFTFGAKAMNPDPANGAVVVNLPLLQWTVGDTAASYDVYYGDDLALVTEGNKSVLVAEGWPHNFYFPGSDFRAGVTYYWRIDMVEADGTVNPGGVWSFTTKAETPPLAYPEPVAWWPFDENEGTVAIDAVRWREGQVVGAVWGPGKLGAALGFSRNAYVKTPFVRSPEDGPIGVFCWVRREDSQLGGVIVSQQNRVNWLMTDNFGELMTELPMGTPLSFNTTIGANEWYYVGLTWNRDDSTLILYVNDDQEAIRTNIGEPGEAVGSSDGLYIGGGAHLKENEYWTGQIDEVQVYDNALLVTEADLDVLKTRQANIVKGEYYTDPATLAPVKIDMNFDKAIAAVLRYGATEEQANAFAASLGLQVADFDGTNRIVTLRLPYDTSRPDVARFTGAARQLQSGSPFAEIGLALTPPLADTSIILNDEFVVQFESEMTDEEVIALTGDAVEIVEKNPFEPNEYLLRVDRNAGVDALYVANRYHENPLTVYGVPNLAIVPQLRGYEPNDPLFSEQWHLHNTPIDPGIDVNEAWEISKGDGVVIAVIDSIGDSDHPDLSGNLWINPGEYGNGKKENCDDDGNGYKDDIHGCDFGYSDDSEGAHGTAVAGCIGAQMDNNIGISGCCPNCKLMLLRCNIWTYDQHLAFDYARTEGADVICCAWGYRHGIPVPQNVGNAIHRAAQRGRYKKIEGKYKYLGCVIVFAMTNEPNDNSADPCDISSLKEVIAVSGCTDQGLLSGFGFGADMDLLAPTSGGTRSIITTDLVGNDGYNPSTAGGSSKDLNNIDYTQFFGGTSAACAITAGVAGLVLSANPNLTRSEVQGILQDTADKIDATDYDEKGYSTGGKHGYGRINAFWAVTTARALR